MRRRGMERAPSGRAMRGLSCPWGKCPVLGDGEKPWDSRDIAAIAGRWAVAGCKTDAYAASNGYASTDEDDEQQRCLAPLPPRFTPVSNG